MTFAGRKLDDIYRRIGEKGFLIFIYCAIAVIHTIFALQMDMMSVDPNEFGVIAWAALFAGKNWSGVMSNVGYYYGYVGSIIYLPIMLIIKNPFTQYKAMLIVNGLVVSFVPVIAYKISKRFGIAKAWERSIVGIICGIYSTIFAHTKFAWNEISCIIYPWLIMYLIICTGELKSPVKKHLMSVLCALASVLAIGAHPRLVSVSISAVVVILFAQAVMKKKLVYYSSYFITLAVSGTLMLLLTEHLKGLLIGANGANSSTLQNTVPTFLASLFELGSVEGWKRLGITIIGHLYYFVTSTWGLGALAVCLVIMAIVYFCKHRNDEDNGRYSKHFILFAVYALSSNIISMLVSSIAKFSSSGYGQYQDTVIFGRYMDSVIPLMIMFIICYVFLYGLNLSKLLVSIVGLGALYVVFFINTVPVIINSPKTRVSPILGLYPIRIGERVDAVITKDGLFLTVSCVMCFLALFIVVVCCTKKYRQHILSALMIVIMVYFSIYTAVVYLPFAATDAKRLNEPIYQLSEYVYNSSEAPPVLTYNVPRRTSTLLQFLNQQSKISATNSIAQIPEHCFIVVSQDDRLMLKPESDRVLVELAQTEDYVFYAYGERAVAFAQSQSGETTLLPPNE